MLAKAAKQPTKASSKFAPSSAESTTPPNPFTNLQRAIGNQGMLHLFRLDDSSQSGRLAPPARPILQTKLTVNEPGDAYEQDADRVADQIMRTPEPEAADSKTIARAIGQYSSQPGREGAKDAPASVHEVLRSPGQPLDAATRAYMEPRFAMDFSRVRIHRDREAAASASEIHARAYTSGQNIVFASNQFSPSSTEGGKLLAHELAHVVQQNSGSTSVQRQPSNEDEAREAEYKAFLDLPQIEKDRAISTFPGAVTTGPQPKQAAKQAETGCHSDPYAHPGSQTACPSHHKTDGEATTVTRRHLGDPEATEFHNRERARLDRLNEAYSTFKKTGHYTHRDEFAPYDIETGNIHSLTERWNQSMASQNADPNKVAQGIFNGRYFVSRHEYNAERRRRIVQAPFEERFYKAVRNIALSETDSQHALTKNMSAEEIYLRGVAEGLFVEDEESLVYEKQGQIKKKAEDERHAESQRIRHQVEIQHEMQWEDQGDAVLNQGMNVFIQPLVMAPLGFVGAVMGVTQTGEMMADAYSACVKGEGDCTSELIQLGVIAATHTALKVAGRAGGPTAPAPNDIAPPPIPEGPLDTAAPKLRVIQGGKQSGTHVTGSAPEPPPRSPRLSGQPANENVPNVESKIAVGQDVAPSHGDPISMAKKGTKPSTQGVATPPSTKSGGGAARARGKNITISGTTNEAAFKAGLKTEPHWYVYEIVDAEGNHLKWGIAKNPYTRFNQYVGEGLGGAQMRVYPPEPRYQALATETAGARVEEGTGMNVRMETRAEMRHGADWAEILDQPGVPSRPLITIRR